MSEVLHSIINHPLLKFQYLYWLKSFIVVVHGNMVAAIRSRLL
jgi:hypothetical protein